MEDTNSCPAFIEREGLLLDRGDGEETYKKSALDSPIINRLSSAFGGSLLQSPTTTRIERSLKYSTPPTPPRYSLTSPKQTPPSPSTKLQDITNEPITPYNAFLKRRCLRSPRRSASVTSLPIHWDEETKTLQPFDDSLLNSPGSSRKRALTQSTPDFSALLAGEKLKFNLEDGQPHVEEQRTPCILPLIPHAATDFNRIDPSTLKAVITGEYREKIEEYVIMDCRYDYEYDGGHIQGAIHMSPQKLFEYFSELPEPEKVPLPKRKLVIIMHCEYSSVRAPKCIELLRNLDRNTNFRRGYSWPLCSFPDVYLLQGGYKRFFETFKDNCVPQEYVPETAKEHKLKRQENKRARKGSLPFLKKTNSFLSKSTPPVYPAYRPTSPPRTPPRKRHQPAAPSTAMKRVTFTPTSPYEPASPLSDSPTPSTPPFPMFSPTTPITPPAFMLTTTPVASPTS